MGTARVRKRLATRIAICLLIGATVTVGVAWWFAHAVREFTLTLPQSAEADPRPFRWVTCSATGSRSALMMPLQNLGYGLEGPLEGARLDNPQTRRRKGVIMDLGFGWPFAALHAWAGDPPGSSHGLIALKGPPLELRVGTGGWLDSSFPSEFLPISPLARPFVADTLIYATPLFLAWSTLAVIRRNRRRARGHCPACGYDLRGAPTEGGATCPECGS